MALAPFFEKAALAASSILHGVDRDAFAALLEQECVAIAWGDNAAQSHEGRVTLELLTNLLSRLYPRVAFVAEGSEALGMRDQLEALAREINPQIEITNGAESVTRAIGVGSNPPLLGNNLIFLGSNGWALNVSTTQPCASGDTANPFGAAAAACVGAANLFRAVFQASLPEPALDLDLSVSVLDLTPDKDLPNVPLADVALTETFLVGAGAVGEAALWVLRRAPTVHGQLDVVEPELVELSNLQRYTLTRMADVGQKKTDVVKEAFASPTSLGQQPTDLHISTTEGIWGDFLASRPLPWGLRRVLVAVDSAEDRIAVQASLPHRVFNAWTQAGDLGVSTHDFLGEGACLACLYWPTGATKSEDQLVAEAIGLPQELMEIRRLLYTGEPIGEPLIGRIAEALQIPIADLLRYANLPLGAFYVEVCGGVLLRLGGQMPSAVEVPMAFQSALAGVLLAAAAVADAAGIASHPVGTKVVWDVLRPLRGTPLVPLAKASRCICRDADYIAIAKSRWGSPSEKNVKAGVDRFEVAYQ